MTKEELLSQFLSGFPNSTHPYDRKRFVDYAVACAKEDCDIDVDAMRSHGLEEMKIHEYELAYGWIRDVCNSYLK